ncbi:11946_t:CDS:2, partial [Dentiscutata heterogama]
MPETEVVAVVIEHSFYIKGRIFEVDVVELLKSLGVNVKHVGGRNDGGIDIIGEIGEVTVLFQCKNWDNPIGPSVVREMRGVVCQENPGTIGILVAPCLTFTDFAIDESRKSRYPVILTDKSHLPKIIINL